MITQELKEKYKKLNQEELNEGFIWACKNDDLEIVKYLLTSPELTEHADIHARNDFGFIGACRKGQLDFVKYLLASDELTEHADIHAENDLGFRSTCYQGHLEVVKYLIIDMNIDKTYSKIFK